MNKKTNNLTKEEKMSIIISKKHGVNPAIPLCFFCNQPKNEVILAGHLPDDAEAPRNAVWNKEPCDTCKEYMRQGILLISTKDGEKGDNPYRTGGWCVVKEEALKKIIPENHPVHKMRMAFIEDSLWKQLELPSTI
jgi:hypothetical protein